MKAWLLRERSIFVWRSSSATWIDFGFKLEPRDLWVGAYWKRWPKALQVVVCPLPLLAFTLYVQWR